MSNIKYAKGIVIGAFAGLAISLFNDRIFPTQSTRDEKQKNQMKKLSPEPLFINDIELINLFVYLAKFRSYNENAYVSALEYTDTLCLIQKQLKNNEIDADESALVSGKICEESVLKELKKLYISTKNNHKDDIIEREKQRIRARKLQLKKNSQEQLEEDDDDDGIADDELVDLYGEDWDEDGTDVDDFKRYRNKHANRLPHEIMCSFIDAIEERLMVQLSIISNLIKKY